MRGDWKDEAMQYRDIDRYAQQEAERQIVIDRVRDNALDLLNAAKTALRILDKGAGYPGWGVAKDILRAAIHKATGEDK